MTRSGGSGQRTQSLGDAVAVFLLVFWLTVGVLVGLQIWSLSRASEAAEASARAVDQAGQALEQLSEIPLVGEGIGTLGNEVRATAAEVDRSAANIRRDVRQLSVLLGLSVALVPTTQILAFYLPRRARRRRHLRDLEAQLAGSGITPELEAYLAHGAVAHLSYRELTTLSRDPVGDLIAGRHTALARAEAERLGLAAYSPPARGGA